ncbi:MAG: FAD binding domain-containing protein [Chloroflexi bacterium]|nr:FAD binding domain-containing protein [Chloroflexota bacterium]
MPEFSYVRATSLEHALALLNEPGQRSQLLAGGTDLIVHLRSHGADWDRVVDISRVPELKVIEANGRITIGAAATFAEILSSPIIQTRVPLLIQACRVIGSVQIRNTATIGGNVANGAECADSVPALICLGAEAVVVSGNRERRMPVSDLVARRSEHLPRGSLIREFVFDVPPDGCGMAYERIGERQAVVVARLSLAALGALGSDGRIALMRLAHGAIMAHSGRVEPVEAMLIGQMPSQELFAVAGRRMAEYYRTRNGGRWSAEYKEQVVAAITERALEHVVGGNGEARVHA